MKASFQTVDVFTDRQFGGNPVAVIPDARGLSDGQMQAIANEFNLAETTFVLPPANLQTLLASGFLRLAPRCRLRAIPTSARRSSWRIRTGFAASELDPIRGTKGR